MKGVTRRHFLSITVIIPVIVLTLGTDIAGQMSLLIITFPVLLLGTATILRRKSV